MNFLLFFIFIQCLILSIDATLEVPIRRHLSLTNKNELSKRFKREVATESPYWNDYLTIDAKLGTPPRTITLMLMSGSTRMWIKPWAHNYKSSTLKNLKKSFSSLDGSYNVSGRWVQDVIQFNGFKMIQPFGSVRKVTFSEHKHEEDLTFPANGILSLSRLNNYQYTDEGEPKAFIDNLLENFLLPVYTIYLEDHKSPKNGPANGFLTFGDFDYKRCHAEPRIYADFIFTNLYHIFDLPYFKFSNYTLTNELNALVDSGVSTLSFETEVYLKIKSIINPVFERETGLHTIPCNTAETLDNITISFNSPDGSDKSQLIHIQPKEFIVDLDLPSKQCAMAITLIDSAYEDIYAILGTPFIRSSCLTFDFETHKMLITKRKTLEEQNAEKSAEPPKQQKSTELPKQQKSTKPMGEQEKSTEPLKQQTKNLTTKKSIPNWIGTTQQTSNFGSNLNESKIGVIFLMFLMFL